MKLFVTSAILAIAIGSSAHAAPLATSFIDFEVTPDGSTPVEGTITQPLRYEFNTAAGLNAVEFRAFDADSNPGLLGVAEVGVPDGGRPFGFFADDGFAFGDTPADETAFDNFFLTTELQLVSVLEITYDTAIGGLNFDLGDVDGAQKTDPGRIEEFTVEFRDGAGDVLSTTRVRGDDDGAGDRSVVNVSYESDEDNIKSVFIRGTTDGGLRLIGIAFDNFDPDEATTPSVVPVPGTLPLAAAGIGAFALFRRRRHAAS